MSGVGGAGDDDSRDERREMAFQVQGRSKSGARCRSVTGKAAWDEPHRAIKATPGQGPQEPATVLGEQQESREGTLSLFEKHLML
ncbi:hypothetical protein VTJ04DRAFT_9024 [Mycothermus thermophilus]|uniref:uncharacterized protein n=1 Tax=Humicola insolens TaxID=85995 RepID=UPI00374309A0